MNAERKGLVLDSWQSVAHRHDHIATAFYERLFEIDPHARALFARTNMVDQRVKVVAMLSDIVGNAGKKLRILYEYDFGDSWEHTLEFEGSRPAEAGKEYPVCLEGARACPPEDCGGVWGYADLVKAIGSKRHPRHKELLEWLGGTFDPEAFDAAKATKAMNQGLPNWRKMM
jgi:hypothetical protein